MKKQNLKNLNLKKKSIASFHIIGGAVDDAKSTHGPCLETCCKCPVKKSKRPNPCHY